MREKTAEGGTRLRRAKLGETYVVPPNCNRIKLLNVLRDKNVAEADTANRICGTCPVKSACQHQQGPGYGFLSQRRDALTSPKLRAHPHSLPDPAEYNYSGVVLIQEEAANSFTTSRSIQVNKSDLQALINHLLLLHPNLFQQVQPLLAQLLNLFNGNINTGKFGLDHLELVSLLPALDGFDPITLKQAFTADLGCLNTTAKYGVDLEDLPKALQKQFLEKDITLADEAEQQILKQWFVELIAILQGNLPGGSVFFHRNRLTITLPDDRHRAIAQAAKTNIFLDATLSREDLALKLGCQPDEIFVCRQKQPCLNNLRLIQVIDMGIMGMHRGANQQKRLAALIAYLRESGIITKAIDFKKFEQDGAHWRDSRGVNYFSQTTTLIIVGAPCPNLHEMLAQYAVLVRQVVPKDDPKSLGLNEGKGYSQQHLSRFWGLLTLLIEDITSKMSKPEPGSQSNEEMEKIKAVGQILEVVASDSDSETVLETIEEVFGDGLQPHEWLLLWQVISSSSQLAVLSALLGTLPVEQLRQLENVVATG